MLVVISSCSDELASLSGSISSDQNQILETVNVSTAIKSPIQSRDYSFYSQGKTGIFENPKNTKQFSGFVSLKYTDNNSATYKNTDIEVTWKSSIDGILFRGSPDVDFESNISKKLSVGVHTIYFEAFLKDKKIISKDSITLSNTIQLIAKNTSRSVKLNWTKYEGNDFISYQIFSEKFEPIAEINDINTLKLEYKNFESFIDEKNYQIIVKTKKLTKHIVGSNIERAHPGEFIVFPYYIRKIIKDPNRPQLYALIGHPNYESDNYGLVIINQTKDTFHISSHILKQSFFTDLEVSKNSSTLFLSENKKIIKLNLDNLQPSTLMTSNDNWNINKIRLGSGGKLLYYSNSNSRPGSKFTILDNNTGSLIMESIVSPLTFSDIIYNSKSNTIYAGKNNSYNSQLYPYSYNNNLIKLIEQPLSKSIKPDESPELFFSTDNQNIFWKNYQLNGDLNILRTFDTPVRACSPSNRFLANYDKVFDYHGLFTHFEFPSFLKADPDLKTLLIFPDDNNVIYCNVKQSNWKNSEDKYYKAQSFIFNFRIGKSNI
ncbi:hypothetical protein [Tenacibaculum sp. C7A-26P2]|uniref:hypothetical protein n=1 Tax=Tenacibaculum sp. C7A-26P2 TaxID=3447504 RepID=UPI003F866DF9